MTRIVDLTLPMREGLRGFEKQPKNVFQRDGYNTSMLHVYSHCGTHMDAQTHFGAGPETIDMHTPARCMGPAWVVDVADAGPRTLIGVSHVSSITHRFQPGDSLLIRTGWSRHIADTQLYRDQLPRIGEDLAHWCVERRVKLLGVEPPSVADVQSIDELTTIHQILLRGGVTIVEGLANLDQLQHEQCFFVALPLKIEGCDGSPVRAIAFEGSFVVDALTSLLLAAEKSEAESRR